MMRWILPLGWVILAFLIGTGVSYTVLWHLQGLDKLTPEDNPAVVLGGFACMVRSVLAGLIAVTLSGLYLVLRSRRRSQA